MDLKVRHTMAKSHSNSLDDWCWSIGAVGLKQDGGSNTAFAARSIADDAAISKHEESSNLAIHN